MSILKLKSSLQKEWDKLEKQETALLIKKNQKKQSALNDFLAEKIPDGLQNTLNKAFCKAFNIMFNKATGIIEKTYNSEKAKENAFINHTLADKPKPSRRSLKRVKNAAGKSAAANLAVSAVSGVGLGVLGIGIPDIVLFVSLVLKNMYQLATSYNIDYHTDTERRFILTVIQAALSFGKEQQAADEELDFFIENGYFETDKSLNLCIDECAKCMSGELLYMKFLQGIPIVGAVGGAFDFIYLKQINEYAKIKYHKRFLSAKMSKQQNRRTCPTHLNTV